MDSVRADLELRQSWLQQSRRRGLDRAAPGVEAFAPRQAGYRDPLEGARFLAIDQQLVAALVRAEQQEHDLVRGVAVDVLQPGAAAPAAGRAGSRRPALVVPAEFRDDRARRDRDRAGVDTLEP